MIWIIIHSDPPRIFYLKKDDYSFFDNKYLSYRILANVETIRNDVDVSIDGSGENASTKVSFHNAKNQFYDLYSEDPPLLEEAVIYKDDWIRLFRGYITDLSLGESTASITIKA